MKLPLLIALEAAWLLAVADAATRTSADYSITAETAAAGGRATSASYTNDGGLGGIGALATAATPPLTGKGGYVGQLYDVLGLGLTAAPATLDENSTRQLAAEQLLDDATLLAVDPATVMWSVVSGSVSSISTSGLATAGFVNAHTPATVRGVFQAFDGTLQLTILNVSNIPLNAVAGSYAGLIAPRTPSQEDTGMLKLKLSKKGSFTGTLILGGVGFKLRGTLDSGGSFATTIPRKGLSPITVQITVDLNGLDETTGTVSDGTTTSPLAADRGTFNAKTNPAPLNQQGAFTVLLQPDMADTSAPQGDGFARVIVNAAGTVKITGQLADGTAFALGALLAKDGAWPLYVRLYAKQGSLSGQVQFDPQPKSDLDAALFWSKPKRLKDARFPGGFDTALTLTGARYIPRAKNLRALDFPDQPLDNGQITLDEGELTAPITHLLTLTTSNTGLITLPNPDIISLTIARGTGLFQGSFMHRATGKVAKMQGVLFQKDPLGFGFGSGYFLSPAKSGFVNVEANP